MPLALFKSLLTTLVVLIAAEQLLSMGQVRGYLHVVPLKPRTLVRIHRWGGIIAWALVLIVTAFCLDAVFRQGYRLYTPRLQAHAVLGALSAVVLSAKVLIANRFRMFLRYHLALGISAAVLLTGTFVFSAVWYFVLGG